MNRQILKLFTQACYHGEYEPENVPNEVVEKFAELLLKEAFTIIKESMVGNDNVSNIDEIIADRLDEAAYDVCDKLGLVGPIYEG
mgnify:CR=1 FL=1